VKPIYLDHAATTPLRDEVLEALEPWLRRHGNPSSQHAPGRDARVAIEEARERVATVLGARRVEIVFTSGGTEANNLALLGRWRAGRHAGAESVAVGATEHSSVLGPARAAAAEGAMLSLLAVDEDGRVLLEAVREALGLAPAVISVQWANNEVGTIQPVADIGGLCRDAGVVFHTDAVQAVGRVEVRVDRVPCDLLTLSGHKIGGPVGAAALFVRAGTPIEPLLHGGGQQSGTRPGTENVAAAVGLATALELAVAERAREATRLAALRDELASTLASALPGLAVNGTGAERVPQLLSVRVPGVSGDMLLTALDLEGVAVSAGSACRSGSVEPSHVLAAMGSAGDDAVIRLSLGRTTTAADVRDAAARCVRVVERLRAHALEEVR
jgi:cysteine desulfurase